jgi:ankyrin repeat protein
MLEGVLQEIKASTDSPQKFMLGDKGAVRMLLDGAISSSIQDSAGNTPLHIAARQESQMTPSGDAASLTVRALVTSGTAIDAKNLRGQTALIVAVDCGQFEVVQRLLELGASTEEPDFDGCRPLLIAVRQGNLPLVQLLLANGAYTGTVVVDHESSTILHWAVKAGSDHIVREILGKGADANARDSLDQTPLHWAASSKNLKVATSLILADADVTAKDNFARTALHCAVTKGSVPLAKLLLDHGANPDALDRWSGYPRLQAERDNVPGMMDAFAEADFNREIARRSLK